MWGTRRLAAQTDLKPGSLPNAGFEAQAVKDGAECQHGHEEICSSAVAMMVPSRFSMKKAPAIRVVMYRGERVFFVDPVYEKGVLWGTPAAGSGSIREFRSG
jgi:hypothetical protein